MFRVCESPGAATLPPYTEIARLDAGERLEGASLRAAALDLLRHHLQRRPASNPFERFGAQLQGELPALLGGRAGRVPRVRVCHGQDGRRGVKLAADHARWLWGAKAAEVVAAMEEIVKGCKALSFRLARRKAFDPEPPIAALAGAWERATAGLAARVG